jgi:hypothetical protein
MKATTLPSPSFLSYEKQKKGDCSVVAIAFFTLLQQKKRRQQSKDGDGNIVANAFFVMLQEKKKVTATLLPLPFSLHYNKKKKVVKRRR